ncbi:hypothetical protein A2W48_02710 [Candidatus Giovannonibacteria bacterium RIFCSPHIGHO2_12_44_12]|uniref:Uncharacterized protein n=1 Tax=Candidatus Giovannonibacteria bacterium RIFCSPHIGHO2_12_44_12 TaxID=1798340 RepID=A0A1F5WXX6_9BACT|nr:MAG: hypothetical protein A2W48_02710 [Candidatus Giovannonibacteria bacterium RIFCSPHIGHO2_12_44_12]
METKTRVESLSSIRQRRLAADKDRVSTSVAELVHNISQGRASPNTYFKLQLELGGNTAYLDIIAPKTSSDGTIIKSLSL